MIKPKVDITLKPSEATSIQNFLVNKHVDTGKTLHKKCQEVNIRLLQTNELYRSMITSIIIYMGEVLIQKYTDYNAVLGVSGANIGIPLNIIRVNTHDPKESLLTMINPKIIRRFGGVKKVKSNCGSLQLEKPIELERYRKIEVTFYGDGGNKNKATFKGAIASTIQHEIDHNKGILITDRHREYLGDNNG